MDNNNVAAWGSFLSLGQPSAPPSPSFSSQDIDHQLQSPYYHHQQRKQEGKRKRQQLLAYYHQELVSGPSGQPLRVRRQMKPDIDPPFPWATTKRATIYTLDHLISHGLNKITGIVRCIRCKVQSVIEFDLLEKFWEVLTYILARMDSMHDRAPSNWEKPVLPTCNSCGRVNSLKPVFGAKKKEINWLFLFLGQLIGCCTLRQLKYFFKHSKYDNHRSGARNRLIYKTYLDLCEQLQPGSIPKPT